MAKLTLKDIAEQCGVSTATVSMVLSGKGSISQEMKDTIKETAERLGYVPRNSRKPKGPGFKNVCILQWEDAPFLWHFSQPFVLKLEKLLVKEGFRPIVIHCLPELDNKTLYREIKSAHAGAVFSVHYVNPKLIDKLEENSIPVIVINNNNYQDRYWSVLADDIQGAHDGTMKMIEMGHRRIAFADYFRKNDAVVIERFAGFRMAMEEKNLEIRDDYIVRGELNNLSKLKKQIENLFNMENPPTAMFIHDDYFAAIIYTMLKELDRKIPEDISMICPGDVLDYSEKFFPAISTMQVDNNLNITMAWELLLSRLESPSAGVKVLKTKQQYIDRGSCIPPGK